MHKSTAIPARLRKFGQYLVILLAIFGSATSANAGPVATVMDWKVYTAEQSGEKICYAASAPVEALPRTFAHGDVSLVVASFSAAKRIEQPSVSFGYAPRDRFPPQVEIGERRVKTYVDGQDAFIESDAVERDLVNSLRSGTVAHVQGVAPGGIRTSYEFNLTGAFEALNRARAECGLPPAVKPPPPVVKKAVKKSKGKARAKSKSKKKRR